MRAAFVIGIAVLSGSVPRPAGAQWVAAKDSDDAAAERWAADREAAE